MIGTVFRAVFNSQVYVLELVSAVVSTATDLLITAAQTLHLVRKIGDKRSIFDSVFTVFAGSRLCKMSPLASSTGKDLYRTTPF